MITKHAVLCSLILLLPGCAVSPQQTREEHAAERGDPSLGAVDDGAGRSWWGAVQYAAKFGSVLYGLGHPGKD